VSLAQSPAQAKLLERLLPVLVYIQARLDEDLSLAVLATEASLSPHHFHRMFRGLIGETPERYCQRLRLERATFQLLVYRRASILEAALNCGFKNHETFTRAFGQHFGVSPRE
jgi:AraC family transcriptional regulator